MADNVIELKVVVDQDTGGLNVVGSNLDKVAGQAQGTEKSFMGLSGSAATLAKNLLGFASAGAVLAFFKSAVVEAEAENQALNRLRFALEATGQSWTKNAKQVQEWGDAIQQSTRFADTEAFEAVGRLSRVTNDLAQAQRAAQIAMGLSVISGKDLATTTEQVAMLASGQERAVMQLRREYGSLIGSARTTQEVMDALAKAAGKAAFEEDSLTKNTNQLKAAYSNLQETIGRGVTPVVTVLIGFFNGLIKVVLSLGQTVATVAAAMAVAMQGSFMAISQAARLHFGRATEEVQQMRMRIKGIMEGSAEEYKGIWTRNTAAVTKAANDQTRIFVQASKEMEREAKERNERIIKNEMEMLKKKAEQDNAHFTEFKEKMDGIYEGMVSGYGDAIGSMIVDGKDFGKSMEEVFKNMAREFISQVTQMMIKWAAFQALTGGAGGFGGGIFGFAKGVDTVVNKPTMFMAGEGGPERVTVQPMAGSNNGGGGGGGSPTNVNIGDIIVKVQLENIDSANVQRLMEAMAREIRAKAGPAVRFSLAAKTLADQNPGRTF